MLIVLHLIEPVLFAELLKVVEAVIKRCKTLQLSSAFIVLLYVGIDIYPNFRFQFCLSLGTFMLAIPSFQACPPLLFRMAQVLLRKSHVVLTHLCENFSYDRLG